jgi:Rad3-related DNA helicase
VQAVELAHLVVMPYAVLLQEESRSAMGIKLKGRVLVIDEAHNLVEAVNASRSVSLSRCGKPVSNFSGAPAERAEQRIILGRLFP